MTDVERTTRRTTNNPPPASLVANQRAPSRPLVRPPARMERTSRNGYGLSLGVIVLLAMGICWILLLVVGPISVVDAMPDLDLGSGISMTPDGQIKVTNDPAPGPMRIPDESEYNGITMP